MGWQTRRDFMRTLNLKRMTTRSMGRGARTSLVAVAMSTLIAGCWNNDSIDSRSGGLTASPADPVAFCRASGLNVIIGTSNNDVLNGTNGADCIVGLGGQDTINGNNGNDIIFGGDGDDIIDGGNGNDQIFGGTGQDRLSGGDGNDQLFGDDGDDTLSGDNGDDRLSGGQGQH